MAAASRAAAGAAEDGTGVDADRTPKAPMSAAACWSSLVTQFSVPGWLWQADICCARQLSCPMSLVWAAETLLTASTRTSALSAEWEAAMPIRTA